MPWYRPSGAFSVEPPATGAFARRLFAVSAISGCPSRSESAILIAKPPASGECRMRIVMVFST
jgi:hypothetical protein